MGLIDFVKNVGRKLDLSKDDDKPQQQAQAKPARRPRRPSAIRDLAQAQERRPGPALVNVINEMGFSVREPGGRRRGRQGT